MIRTGLTAAFLVFGFLAGGSAFAGPRSVYTDTDPDKCALLEQEPEFGMSLWRCPGVPGYDVFLREADLRFYLSFAPEGEFPKEQGTTLGAFNRVGPKLEWRLTDEGRPYATILRYYVDRGTNMQGAAMREGQVLVVSKFEAGTTCHMALVDALETPEANAVAREKADARAPHFVCESGAPDL